MLLSIIILSWNNFEHLNELILSIKRQKGINPNDTEIIVIDNASNNKLEIEESANLRCIMLARNTGFSEGMNIGYKNSIGKYVLLLNQDVILEDNYIAAGINILMDQEDTAWVGGAVYKIHANELTDTIAHSGYYLRNRFQPTHSRNSALPEDVFMVSPASIFGKRACFDNVTIDGNLFPNYYFAYWEDVDLAYRLLSKGYKIKYFPDLKIWHHISGSAGGNSRLVDKNIKLQIIALSNRRSTILRNVQINDFFPGIIYILLAELIMPIYYLVVSPKTLFSLFLSYIVSLKRLNTDLKHRKTIQKEIIVKNILRLYTK